MVRSFLSSLTVTPELMCRVVPTLCLPLPCLLWDERFSSVSAQWYQYVEEPGRRGHVRPLPQWKKRGIDAYAALIILRGVLECDWARYQAPPRTL